MNIRVKLSERAQREFEELPIVIKVRVRDVFHRLSRWPDVSGAKPLSGHLAGRHRIRTGDYRVQFRVESTAVVVEQIGHRDRFYGR